MKTNGSLRVGAVAALLLLTLEAASAADINEGRQLYDEYCAHCHGADGSGEFPGMPDFQRGHQLMRPDQELFTVISQGQGSMPSFEGLLYEQEILDVVAYLRTFMGQY